MILRHTSAAEARGYAQDADRPLTEQGVREAGLVASLMKKLLLTPDEILTSPYRRARETAGIIARDLAGPKPEDLGALLPGADPFALMNELSRKSSSRVLIVGHAPDLGELVGYLCCRNELIPLLFGKGCLAVLELEPPVRRRCSVIKALLPLPIVEILDR